MSGEVKTLKFAEDKSKEYMMEEFRIKTGAREYKGPEFLDLNRFADDTRHMIIFDVVCNNSSWGDRKKLYLNEIGYDKALAFQKEGYIKIKSHAKGCKGDLFYDSKEAVH